MYIGVDMIDETKDAKWKKEESNMIKLIIFSISFFALMIAMVIALCFLTGCTLSFQNISTHGTAQDLVDEDLTTSPKTDATIPVNISAVPKP